jgi:hypothetical protein
LDWTSSLIRRGFVFIKPEADYFELYAKEEAEAESSKFGSLNPIKSRNLD